MSTSKWYVLHCHSRYEDAVDRFIHSKGIESYYPFVVVNPVNPRAHKIKPFFPGYIFIRTDLHLVGESMFNKMPFSNGLVTFGGEPAVLEESVVRSIRQHLEETNQATKEIKKNLKPGQRITIEGGIFAGQEANFLSYLSGNQRVKVLLQILSHEKYISVELPISQIKQ
jgi:transcriptional antiterminator RfaH